MLIMELCSFGGETHLSFQIGHVVICSIVMFAIQVSVLSIQ